MEFEAKTSGTYSITINPYKLQEGYTYGFYILNTVLEINSDEKAYSLIPTLNHLIELVSSIEDTYGDKLQLVGMNGDVATKSQYSSFTRTCYEDKKYMMAAVADPDRVTDLDLCLYQEDGTKIACDTDKKAIAVANYLPTFTSNVTLKANPYAMTSPYTQAFYAVLVYMATGK